MVITKCLTVFKYKKYNFISFKILQCIDFVTKPEFHGELNGRFNRYFPREQACYRFSLLLVMLVSGTLMKMQHGFSITFPDRRINRQNV